LADRHNRDLDRELPPAPQPLSVAAVDSHAHLEIITNTAPDSEEIRAVIEAANLAGITRLVQVGYSAEQSKWCVKLAELYPGKVLAAVALHPNEAPVVTDLDADLAVISELAKHPRVRAIGETGLDYFRTPPELRQRQQMSFKKHIQIAKDNNLALVIHDRDAHEDVLQILEEVDAPDRTIFHCYSGDLTMAKYCVERGYVISFAGTVTFKNAPALREAVKYVPDHLLLVETDSPFLAPSPHRGALNTPAQIANIVRFIAAERDASPEHVASVTTENALRIFGTFD
jgi:TatD DNase family protein